MGDFNINFPYYNTDKDTSDYIDILYSHTFYPIINSPARVTPNIISGNIATSISDHLT